MSERHDRLLAYLAGTAGWVTAAELADRLGVTSRSVRSYVTAVKLASHPLDVIESSTAGYRLNREAHTAFRGARDGRGIDGDQPRDRLYPLARRLADSPSGVDIFALAEEAFVSESTVEADLRKLKPILDEFTLTIVRRGASVSIDGTEYEVRRMLSRMFRETNAQGFLELANIEQEFASTHLRALKTDLIAMLDAHGYFVNEYGINNVLLHVAIAVDRRARSDRSSAPHFESGAERDRAGLDGVAAALDGLIRLHFGAHLAAADLDYLAALLTTRVITRGYTGAGGEVVAERIVDHEIRMVRMIVERVAEEYLVDLHNEEFIVRLALHVNNLTARARDRSSSHNPMSRSIKTSYPMIYEIAVFIASEIQKEESIVISDDEISYIALHVGSYLERQTQREERVTCAIVCPNYYDMHVLLRHRIEEALGDDIQVEVVITRTDVDWDELGTELVLTTIRASTLPDDVVVMGPFLGTADIEAIRRAIARVRRQRRQLALGAQLTRFFDESLFLRNFYRRNEKAMIEAMGGLMVAQGIIDESYIRGTIEREQMSSTAFTDNLAVPHALTMTAERTAICIAINENAMDWGENRVNVVALIAFSARDRTAFQSTFDQFVSVFADRDNVQRLVRRSKDFPTFIDEIVRTIDT